MKVVLPALWASEAAVPARRLFPSLSVMVGAGAQPGGAHWSPFPDVALCQTLYWVPGTLSERTAMAHQASRERAALSPQEPPGFVRYVRCSAALALS